MTPNKAGSETRLRIRRRGDALVKKFACTCGCKAAASFWSNLRAAILDMDEAQDKRPGGLGRKKAK